MNYYSLVQTGLSYKKQSYEHTQRKHREREDAEYYCVIGDITHSYVSVNLHSVYTTGLICSPVLFFGGMGGAAPGSADAFLTFTLYSSIFLTADKNSGPG